MFRDRVVEYAALALLAVVVAIINGVVLSDGGPPTLNGISAMLDKTSHSPARCPKCNGAMKLVEDPPRFAVLLSPCSCYRCEPCQIALIYPPDEQSSSRSVHQS
jgi:hypothetical protein